MKTTPHEASGLALDFLIKHAQTNRGTMNALAEALTARTGQTVYRQYVGQWLCPDPKRRVQPELGMGLLLIEEGCNLVFGNRLGWRKRWLKTMPKQQAKKSAAKKAKKKVRPARKGPARKAAKAAAAAFGSRVRKCRK